MTTVPKGKRVLGLHIDLRDDDSDESTPGKAGGMQQTTVESDPLKESFSLSANGTLKAGDFAINKSGVSFGEESESKPKRPLLMALNKERRSPMEDLIVLQTLGSGSSGFVRKVVYQPQGTVLALKTVRLDLQDPTVRRQILFELKKLNEFDSEHIVTFHGAFLQDGAVHIALEYMDASLQDVKRKLHKLSEDILAVIVKQVLLGLKYLHENHTIHRDIKPGNILINCFGKVKIADFGVSGELASSMARCKTWVGTTPYMSPERIKGETYSYDSDLWSLGITLMELRTGVFPFAESSTRSFFDLLDLIVVQPAPRLSRDDASDDLIDFVDKCLEKGPQRPTAEKLLGHPFVTKAPVVDMRKWFTENMIGNAREAQSPTVQPREKPPALPTAFGNSPPKKK